MEQEPQTIRERAVLLLRATFLPGRQPTVTAGQGLVWAIRGAIVLGVLILIASNVDKTLWDWLELLFVPAALAVGAYWFNRRLAERASEAEAVQRERELEVENQRAQDAALQAYIDKIGQIVEEYRLSAREVDDAETNYQATFKEYEKFKKAPKEDEDREAWQGTRWRDPEDVAKQLAARKKDLVAANRRREDTRTVIRVQTLTVLDRIEDGPQGAKDSEDYKSRKRIVMRFLVESGFLDLMDPREDSIEDVKFTDSDLKSIIEDANFTKSDLRIMSLSGKNLQKARLTDADLRDSNLFGADLSGADLSGADLSGADLMQSDMSGTKLFEANLFTADLSKANLFRAQGLTDEQLSATRHS